MRWRYGVGAPDRGSRARRRNTRSGNGHRAVARTVAAPNVLPQLKAGTPLEVFAYDRANVKMLATGRVAAMTARSIPPPVPCGKKNGEAGDCSSHANTGRRQDRKLDANSLAGGSRADRGRGPLDNSLQFRNAGAAIGAGAKRSPNIGDVCGTPFSHSAADGFKPDTVTGADDRAGFGNALGALAGKKKSPVALGQNSRIEQRAHDLPSRRILRR